MQRRSTRDAAADRQRSLFGVDKLERHLFDVMNEVLRLALKVGMTDNAHLERLREAVLEYEETQRSDWNVNVVKCGGNDGKATGKV